MASVLLSYEFKNKTISVMLVVAGGRGEAAGRVVAEGWHTKQAAALF